jgi:hypothetical protein
MAAVGGIAGLSQLMAWPTEHLTEAAEHWEAVAARSYGVVNQVWRDALTADWQGEGAEAPAYRDARRLADHQRSRRSTAGGG